MTDDESIPKKTAANIFVHAPEEHSPTKGAGSPLRKFPSQALSSKLGSIVQVKKTPTLGPGQVSESASDKKHSPKGADLAPIEQSRTEDRSSRRHRGGSRHSR